MSRKICIVSGTRAEYGLLRPLMKVLRADAEFRLQLVATGAHLSPEFGHTVDHFAADGFSVDACVDMLVHGDSPVAVAKSVGLACIGFADVFRRLAPDLVLLLGDRYEMLAAAQTALLANVPIAHLHGGEVTEGAIDESIRHAITKMASLHFVSTEVYRRRVIQMGEHPDHVWCVGAIGLDSIFERPLRSREALEDDLEMDLSGDVFMITLHPETKKSADEIARATEQMLQALACFPEAAMVFTGANADACGRRINARLQEFVARAANPRRIQFRMSLGHERYLSLAKTARVMIGNSSSGILEAHSLGLPCVNLGDRQKGRIRPPSVVDCEAERDAIVQAIQTASSDEFRGRTLGLSSPYGTPGVTERIVTVLRDIDLNKLRQKSFFDIDFSNGTE